MKKTSELLKVPKRNENNSLIGIAGVHYIVSELSRRGIIALPTVKNTAAYDIVALNKSGTVHANIQVKTSSKKVSFFPMPKIDDIRTNKNDFYVLARWIESDNNYECFLVSGKEAKESVCNIIEDQKLKIKQGTRKGIFYCMYVSGKNGAKSEKWKRNWKKWNFEK